MPRPPIQRPGGPAGPAAAAPPMKAPVKPTSISAEALFEAHREALRWEWIAGHAHPERRFDDAAVRDARSAADLVGYLNYIHPYRVQIVGRREVAYLNASALEDQERRISRIVTLEPPVIIVADAAGAARPPGGHVRPRRDPAVRHRESAGHVIDVVRGYLGQHFADRTTRHGVFMDILGLGVLLTGESGLGKSELGLELMSRGHGLVADDAVDIYRISQTALEGRCPALLQNLLEVRGIGLLDIKAIFGETAVRRKMRLKLIVHLVRKETMEREFERLPYEPLYEDILGLPVRKVVIAVDAGRNLAVLVEAAVRNTVLQLRGIDTYQEFIERHQRAMEKGLNEPDAG
jgi:HPr kinase/phosphorylase